METAVSIGTGFPTRSYKEKCVINNRQRPEGAVKHPKKGKKRKEKRERDARGQPHGDIPRGGKGKGCLNTPDSGKVMN